MDPDSGSRKGEVSMRCIVLLLMLIVSWSTGEASASETLISKNNQIKSPPKISKLEVFALKAMSSGMPGRVPGPIAGLIGVREDFPTTNLRVTGEQTTDNIYRLFKVMIEKLSDAAAAKPVGIVLVTDYRWPGNDEGYWFHASLDGKLEKVIAIPGKLDAQGNEIKGSATAIEKDINSPEIKERFQHELDLWLKKSYLKKEWKSAEFVDGVLKKKS